VSRALALSPAQQGILRAALEAIVPEGAGLPGSAADAAVEAGVRAFCESAGFAWLGLALRLLDASPWLVPPFRAHRFSRLPLEERVRLLEAHEQSRFFPRRAAVHALKQVVMLAYYSRPEVEAALGYPSPLARVPR
jgi:hypothetical protein